MNGVRYVRYAFVIVFVVGLSSLLVWSNPKQQKVPEDGSGTGAGEEGEETEITKVEAPKPNILIIFADDVGTDDVPGYWDKSDNVKMPNLEKLMSQGTTFTDAHSTPLCAPSRYTLLSGNYPHRGQKDSCIWSLNYEKSQFIPGQQSIAQVLNDNGYQTSMFGKWHLGGKLPKADNFEPQNHYLQGNEKSNIISSVNHNWTKPIQQGPFDIGFNHSYISTGGIQNPPYLFLRNSQIEQRDLENVRMWNKGSYGMPHGTSKIKAPGEGTDSWDSTAYNMILVNETERFLDMYISENQTDTPFFTYVALGAVHAPHSPPSKYLDGTPVAGVNKNEHMDLLGEMDKVVGSLIQMLEDRDLIENTIIVFTSDNGGLRNADASYSRGPLKGLKGSLYEGGHRIPMTIRWDQGNIPRGETRSKLVALNDVYATLCELAVVDVPSGNAIDSISFASYLQDQNKTENLRSSVGVWRYQGANFYGEALRRGDMKLVHLIENDVFELYNLTEDISENNNIALDNADLVQDMFSELKYLGPTRENSTSDIAPDSNNVFYEFHINDERDPDDGGY